MKVNGMTVIGNKFAYDGCHKIYVIESAQDEKEALHYGYKIYPIERLENIYIMSCPLRFIVNWKLDKVYAAVCEEGIFCVS